MYILKFISDIPIYGCFSVSDADCTSRSIEFCRHKVPCKHNRVTYTFFKVMKNLFTNEILTVVIKRCVADTLGRGRKE